MFQETSGILIVSFGVVFLAFFAGVILFIVQAKKNRVVFKQEKDVIAQQHQQELMQAQLDIQQQTMQHIGREIHDNVGQKLTLASLYSKQLTGMNGGKLDEKASDIGAIIDESLAELRQLSKSLTNPELISAGLMQLLTEEAKKINAAGVCHVSITGNGEDVVLAQGDKHILFRLLQEFIQNSLKHAACRKVNINLQKEETLLRITAEDDGKGFDIQKASTGIGLQNMKRRAEQLNANFQLDSKLGEGTTMILQFNLPG